MIYMKTNEINELRDFAVSILVHSGRISRKYFRTKVQINTKKTPFNNQYLNLLHWNIIFHYLLEILDYLFHNIQIFMGHFRYFILNLQPIILHYYKNFRFFNRYILSILSIQTKKSFKKSKSILVKKILFSFKIV